jgi:hypothetical protein
VSQPIRRVRLLPSHAGRVRQADRFSEAWRNGNPENASPDKEPTIVRKGYCVRTCLWSLSLLLLAVSAVRAQQVTSIAGLVKDSSGAVLPGVTVEATSPALIEKVRSVITDGQGQYRIVDLRPATYSVTFTLPGFAAIKVDNVTLTSGFTATVNAEMKPGAVEETVTVSGASPLVDTQNVRQQTVVPTDLIQGLPLAKGSVTSVVTLIAGLTGQVDVGGSAGVYVGQTQGGVSFHGKSGVKRQFDGMRVNNVEGSGASGYVVDPSFAEEMVVETGGISAESPASGVLFNSVPKEGGNSFRFTGSGTFTNDNLGSDNLTDALRARGLASVNKVLRLFDVDSAVGGPIRRDRLWFYAGFRGAESKQQLSGVFFNKTQGTPLYTPDLSRPAYREQQLESVSTRFTWQISERNKLGISINPQHMIVARHQSGTGFVAPEAVPGFKFWPQGLYQVSWNRPVTSRLLLESGAGVVISHWPNFRQPETSPDDISIVELRTGFRYNSAQFGVVSYGDPKTSDRFTQRSAVSFITGSHAYKAGIQIEEGIHDLAWDINHGIDYQFLDARPVSLNQYAIPYRAKETLRADLGAFVQDTWSIRRITFNYGLRFDYLNSYVPAQHVPAGPWVPARDFDPVYNVPKWSDVNPRAGVSYDLFGNGRTAVKASIGRYLGVSSIEVAAANNPMVTSVNSVNRTWADVNGNYTPDCDLTNSAANGECGAISDTNFGRRRITTRWADDVIHGFGNRDYLWDVSTQVQHELVPGLSLTAGYYRNWAGNFRVTDNVLVTPEDYSPFCITAPTISANGFTLPGGGGYQVCGLYDIVPAKFGRVDNLVTQASNFGRQQQISDFTDVRAQTRFRSGLEFGGGVDTGRTVNDSCFVVDSPQQLVYCRVVTPFAAQTQLKIHGSYPIAAGFVVSAVYQNLPGPSVNTTYVATNREVAPSLGRNLAACGSRTIETCTATVAVPVVAPQTLFEDRRSQLDLRVSKMFTLNGNGRLYMNVDLYNVLNAASILVVNNSFGPQYRRPITTSFTGAGVLDGRLLQFSGRVTF